MDKLSTMSKWIIVGVVAIIAVVLIAVYGGRQDTGNAPNAAPNAPAQGNNVPGASAPAKQNRAANPPAARTAPPLKSAGGAITSPAAFITPAPGAAWIFATPNTISWSREIGVPGAIELLDASTLAPVGVILTSVGPHQTSYDWNTRDLYVSRTSPAKITVLPGRYVVRAIFDGPAYPPITSQPITIAITATPQ